MIKLELTLIRELKDSLTFEITYQSSRNFSHICVGGWCIDSVCSPEISGHTIYLQGNNPARDNRPITFYQHNYDAIKALAKATELRVRLR